MKHGGERSSDGCWMLEFEADWLKARTAASPDALALTLGERRWTYAALDETVDRICGWLVGQRLPTNGRLGALLDNSLEYVALVHAAARLGLVLVPLNTRLTAAELAWQRERVGVGLIVTSEPYSAISRQLPVQAQTLTVDQLPPVHHSAPFKQSAFTIQPDSKKRQSPLDAVQAIVFTSGTTGRPKGVALTFGNHFYSAMASAYKLGVEPNDLWLSSLPLYHVGGLAVIFRSCLYGTAVDLHARFELDAVNHALDTKPITLISVVPTMLYRLVQTRQSWPASLRLILVGGAAASAELVQQANQLGNEQLAMSKISNLKSQIENRKFLVATTYGMTEAASQIATQLPAQTAAKPTSVGRPLLFTEVKIVGDDGGERPRGAYGEVWVRGPQVTRGYFDNPEANASRFMDGWFRTGDIGYVDADGDLFIVQRRSDLIVSGGENIYPAEVEGVLRRHPAVKEVCVVGVADVEWGQRPAAMVALAAGAALTAEELLAFGREQLAGYKLPRRILFVQAMPQTASGKIERQAVQAALEEAAPPRNGDPDRLG